MKKKMAIGSVAALLLAGGICGLFNKTKPYFRQKFMTVSEAKKAWPNQRSFETAAFKTGTEQIRASMVVDLIESRKYVDKPVSSVREELGTPDGYLSSEAVPAYIIQDRKPGEKKDAWQVVFIPDKPGGIVKEVKIHKNCCYSDKEYGVKGNKLE